MYRMYTYSMLILTFGASIKSSIKSNNANVNKLSGRTSGLSSTSPYILEDGLKYSINLCTNKL